ncbi:MAG: YlmC/YmxH family sporulation protein [Firmicutes bacterium]|nr:YlmC/YmxH family sporulation protein [Bacillota bacterium]
MYIKTSELRSLDVINITDGSILGNVCDVDLDPETGRLLFLILEKPNAGFFRFLRHDDLEIPWDDVILVGTDVVLVEMREKYSSYQRTWQRKRI